MCAEVCCPKCNEQFIVRCRAPRRAGQLTLCDEGERRHVKRLCVICTRLVAMATANARDKR